MNSNRHTARVWRYLALGLVSGLGLYTILATGGEEPTDTQGYTIAFPARAGTEIRVRSSVDGMTWIAGNFPEGQGPAAGVGVAAVPSKLLYLVGWRDGDQIRLLRGLGPENWESEPLAQIPQEVAHSAPSLTYGDNGRWLIAFRAERDPVDPSLGDRTIVRIFDTSVSPAQYLEGTHFGYPGHDTHSIGRPAVAYANGKVLLVWQTGPNPSEFLHVGVGELSADGITWQARYQFASDCGTIRSSPVLTHDHSAFYVGFLCNVDWLDPTRSVLRIFKSTADGTGWQFYGNWNQLPQAIRVGAHIGLAGRADGSLVAAALAINGNPEVFAARCAGGAACQEQNDVTWDVIDANALFGPAASGPFALIATGHPAQ